MTINAHWQKLITDREKWEITPENKVIVYDQEFPIVHPCTIHLKLYRTLKSPERRYIHLKAAHDYFWPTTVWHYWTERRFREHCEWWNYIGWAGLASSAKSWDAAKILNLFWLSNPKKNAVIVASTTLNSLEGRVWGYVKKQLNTMAVKMPFQIFGGNNPRILYPVEKQNMSGNRDTIHGMFAVAAKQGSDDSAISNWIGRHPDEALMLVLDECTDLNPAIAKAFPNLDSSSKPFQVIGIGNSNSHFDLHGAICTPKAGWNSVDPFKDIKWETTQKNGICLLFTCYESPAVHETDPVIKAKLGKFLITEEQIKEKEKELGTNSDGFWRFVMGFWKNRSTENTIVTTEFMNAHDVYTKPEWLGFRPLEYVAGLDAGFSTGGDQVILRIAVLGQTVHGEVVLDFMGEQLLFRIPILAQSQDSAEIQIAKQVCKILDKYRIPLNNLCLDGTGQGRALGGTLLLQSGQSRAPLKIYTVRAGSGTVNSFDVVIRTPYDLWSSFRDFIEHNQIKGLDSKCAAQLVTRLLLKDETTGKVKLEPKKDYKKRMNAVMPSLAHSPDEADAAALCIQAAMINFGFTPGQKDLRGLRNEQVPDPLLAYKIGVRMVQEDHVKNERRSVPVAKFSGSLEDAVRMKKPW